MIGFVTRKLAVRNRYNETVRELSRMSNRELADIGIARSDIEKVARQNVR